MAIQINQGTQTAVATDLAGTLHYQIIKLDMGAAGTTNLFSGTSNALPVTLNSLGAGENLLTNRQEVMVTPYVGTAYSPSHYSNYGGTVAAGIKTTSGNLASFYATSLNGTVRYIQFHNGTAAPATGGTPVLSFDIPPSDGTVRTSIEKGKDYFSENGLYIGTAGIAFAFSTAQGTYAPATAADHAIDVNFY